MVPLTARHAQVGIKHQDQHQINNIYHLSSQQKLIEYLHQCFFSPTKSTLLKAIQHDNLLGIPGLTEHAVKKYLPESTATIKGHLHQTRKNLRSTRSHAKLIAEQENNINDDLKPQENKMHHVKYFVLLL